jgi:hypothetical protein
VDRVFGVGVFLLMIGGSCLLLSLNRLGGKVDEMHPADRARRGGPPGATGAREAARQWKRLVAIGVPCVLIGGLLMLLR